jgi:hypothetical protein
VPNEEIPVNPEFLQERRNISGIIVGMEAISLGWRERATFPMTALIRGDAIVFFF